MRKPHYEMSQVHKEKCRVAGPLQHRYPGKVNAERISRRLRRLISRLECNAPYQILKCGQAVEEATRRYLFPAPSAPTQLPQT